MAKTRERFGRRERVARDQIALSVLVVSALALTALAIAVVNQEPKDAMTVFNVLLPVVASWVGTVLAFYFGKDTFEAANEQVRKTMNVALAGKTHQPVPSFMRLLAQTTHFTIPSDKGDGDVPLSELTKMFTDKVKRLPILTADDHPRYMIHEASISTYLADTNHDVSDTLEAFIEDRENAGVGFGNESGFVVVAETANLEDAKNAFEKVASAQDIFVTKAGTTQEPVVGWISNVRLTKHLSA